MQETEHYKLKKPAAEEFYDVRDQNSNMDKIDAELFKRPVIQVGGEEPGEGPCIWFDTSGLAPNMVSASLELGGPGDTAELIAQVDSTDFPVENAKTGGTPKAGEYSFDII